MYLGLLAQGEDSCHDRTLNWSCAEVHGARNGGLLPKTGKKMRLNSRVSEPSLELGLQGPANPLDDAASAAESLNYQLSCSPIPGPQEL